MQVVIETGRIEDVLRVAEQIPEFTERLDQDAIASRLANNAYLILIAKVNGKPVAYKMGYQDSDTIFYSWLGGVSPDYRNQHIATKLRQHQELWALEAGYQAITVKSMNRYPGMLQLLIRCGYQINGYLDNGCHTESKVCFIKSLVHNNTV